MSGSQFFTGGFDRATQFSQPLNPPGQEGLFVSVHTVEAFTESQQELSATHQIVNCDQDAELSTRLSNARSLNRSSVLREV